MIGTRLRKYRIENGYSQKDLAKVLNVNVRTVSRWELNYNKPSQEELERIAKLIGVSESELLSDEELTEEKHTEDSKQIILNSISDSVDNLVTGQEIINETITSNQDKLISELKSQNVDLMSRIQTYEKALDTSKSELRHKRIRTIAVVITCLIILIIVIGSWFYWRNFSYDGNYIEGAAEKGTPSFYEIDDGK